MPKIDPTGPVPPYLQVAEAGAMHALSGGEGESVRATLGLSGTSDVVVVSTDGELADSGGGSA